MKKNIKFITVGILLTLILSITLFAGNGNGEVKDAKNGNGEVLHHSFLEGGKAIKKVIEDKYPNTKVVVQKITQKAVKYLMGRNSDSYTPHRDINLTGKDRFILHANISEAKKPISCNIKSAKLVQDNKRVTVDIAVREIKERVIIKNANGEVLIEFSVIK